MSSILKPEKVLPVLALGDNKSSDICNTYVWDICAIGFWSSFDSAASRAAPLTAIKLQKMFSGEIPKALKVLGCRQPRH